MMIDRKGEAFGHNPDDCVRNGSQSNGPAQNAGIAREPVPPHFLADDGHRLRPWSLVVLGQITSQQGPYANGAKSGGAHGGNADALRWNAGCDEIRSKRLVCADL